MGMNKIRTKIVGPPAAILAAMLGLVLVPSSPAGSATSCVAWAQLPARVSLAGHEVYVRATLQGTPECAGVTADSGGSATLNGPGPSTSDFPLRWNHLGDSDTAPLYASLNAIGTYRVGTGELQTYDARYFHIPYEWRATSTVVKYAGRFDNLSRADGALSATLQYFTKYDWAAHAGVRVQLQRRTGTGWQTVAQQRTSGAGRVSFRDPSGTVRLVSATTGSVWSATTAPRSAGV
jgi:hypothetical protein